MMLRVTDITAEPIQRHRIIIGNETLVLLMRYHSFARIWTVDITFRERSTRGVKLSVATLHLLSNNWPLDLLISDESGEGIDPYALDDFEKGRCFLYVLQADTVAAIRGYDVP